MLQGNKRVLTVRGRSKTAMLLTCASHSPSCSLKLSLAASYLVKPQGLFGGGKICKGHFCISRLKEIFLLYNRSCLVSRNRRRKKPRVHPNMLAKWTVTEPTLWSFDQIEGFSCAMLSSSYLWKQPFQMCLVGFLMVCVDIQDVPKTRLEVF